jgi:hypothetical protein
MMQNKMVHPDTGRQQEERKKLAKNKKGRGWKESGDWRPLSICIN